MKAVRRSPKIKDEEKLAFAQRAVEIKERHLGPWHPDVATSLTNLAVQRTLAADPANARPLLERAVATASDSYLAFVLRKESARPAVVPLGDADSIDTLIVRWRQQIDQEAMSAGRASVRSEGGDRSAPPLPLDGAGSNPG